MTWDLEALVPLESATMPTLPLAVSREEAEHAGISDGQIVQVKCKGGFVMEVDQSRARRRKDGGNSTSDSRSKGMLPAPPMTVTCLLCGQAMERSAALAEVIHHFDPEPSSCRMVRYRCNTPDCGNEVIVEDR